MSVTRCKFRINENGFVLHDAPCESRAGLVLIDGIWRAFCRECHETSVATLDEIASGLTGRLDPSLFGLRLTPAADTYLDDFKFVWIGTKWDIAERDERFHVYRKGNWVCAVGTLDLACRIVADNEGWQPGEARS